MTDCNNTYGPKYNEEVDDGCGASTTALDPNCKTWQLSLSNDAAIIDSYVAESLNIASADANVYKLLGVHEQEKLIDATGFGDPISSGNIGAYPASNAFTIVDTAWKSIQRGESAVLASAFIGYDFGLIKTNEGTRRRYSVDDAAIRKHITAISLKQSSNPLERATKIRIERSQCGMKWKGVQVINVPDDECLNTFLLKDSVTSRYWRIRPLEFNGGDSNSWSVRALQMVDNYLATNEDNVQDKILLENRDREYDMSTITVKVYFDLQEAQTDLSRFGLQMTNETLFAAANFSSAVVTLGRPFIIGDIIEIPSLAQYSADMTRVEKYYEVVDTLWASEGFTPTWQPTLQRLILQPAFASRETQNVFGDLSNEREVDALGLLGGDDGNHPLYADYTGVTEEIHAQSKIQVPERGTDVSGIKEWSTEEIVKARAAGVTNIEKTGRIARNRIPSTTTIPPDNLPYTEGVSLPEEPNDGDYHRLVVDGQPIQLYKYIIQNQGWSLLAEIPSDIGSGSFGSFQSSDGMPPNSAPYTEGDDFPEYPKDKDYHRLTYTKIDDELPARLHRYSDVKKRWIYIESDYRALNNNKRSVLSEFLNNPNTPIDKITRQ